MVKRAELPGAEKESRIASQPSAISAIPPSPPPQPAATVADWTQDGNSLKSPASALHSLAFLLKREKIGDGGGEREIRMVRGWRKESLAGSAGR